MCGPRGLVAAAQRRGLGTAPSLPGWLSQPAGPPGRRRKRAPYLRNHVAGTHRCLSLRGVGPGAGPALTPGWRHSPPGSLEMLLPWTLTFPGKHVQGPCRPHDRAAGQGGRAPGEGTGQLPQDPAEPLAWTGLSSAGEGRPLSVQVAARRSVRRYRSPRGRRGGRASVAQGRGALRAPSGPCGRWGGVGSREEPSGLLGGGEGWAPLQALAGQEEGWPLLSRRLRPRPRPASAALSV